LETIKPKLKCAYFAYCYIAEASDCFGYKMDCPLYMETNDQRITEEAFHRAMNQLIDQTKLKYQPTKK
jgi:hypothetical protein